MGVRILKFLCINNPHVREMKDTGLVQSEFSSNRQAIVRMLEKRTEVEGGRKMPTFVLAEPPSELLFEEDKFDDLIRDTDGNWKLPSEAWMAERNRRIEADAERLRDVDAKARDLLKDEVAGNLADLISMLRPEGAAPARQRGKKGDG